MAQQLYRLNISQREHPVDGTLISPGETFLVESSLVPASWLGASGVCTLIPRRAEDLGPSGRGTYGQAASKG